MQINTLDTIHTILHPTFQLAVRDEIIRVNPSDGVMAEIRKKTGNKKEKILINANFEYRFRRQDLFLQTDLERFIIRKR